MGVVTFILYTVEVLVCLLLMVAILIQRSKSQGIGLAFGAGMGEAMFGSQAGNVLTRATVIMAAIFLANTTLLAMLGSNREERSAADSVVAVAPAAPEIPASVPGPVPLSGGMPGGGADGFAPLATADAAASAPVEAAPVAGPVTAIPTEPIAIPSADAAPAAPAP